MAYLAYIGAGALGLYLSYGGLVMAMVSGLQFAYLVGGLLLVAHAGSIFYFVRMARAGKGPQAAIVLVLPIFAVMAIGQIVLLVWGSIAGLMPNSDAFKSACTTAGAKFHKLPSQAVQSIAYDWTGNIPPPTNRFSVLFGTRMTSNGRSNYPHPPSIEFSERKRSNLEGRPTNGPDGPYIRFPKTGPYYAINELTADVLVKTQVRPEEELKKPEMEQGLITYDVSVTDRRTSELLANLRYAVDQKGGRACGLTDGSSMDLRSFVLKSVGVH